MRCRATQRTSGLCWAFIARHSIAIPRRRDSQPKKDALSHAILGIEVDRLVDVTDASKLCGGQGIAPHWGAVEQDVAGGLRKNGGMVCCWQRGLVHEASDH